jgi:Amidohydrolase family
VTQSQLLRMKELGLATNLFTNHIYYWGDLHYSTFTGPDRAEDMDPAGSAQRLGIPFSMHSDASVTPVDPLFCMWTATARKTMSGRVLGENERITVPQALHAVTLGAASLGRTTRRVRSKQASSPISPCLTAIRSTSPRPTSSETSRRSAPSWAAKPFRLVPSAKTSKPLSPAGRFGVQDRSRRTLSSP